MNFVIKEERTIWNLKLKKIENWNRQLWKKKDIDRPTLVSTLMQGRKAI
jgi:hypothetical protein